MYWIHFQNIHTFTNQKKLLHTLVMLVVKITESLSLSQEKEKQWEWSKEVSSYRFWLSKWLCRLSKNRCACPKVSCKSGISKSFAKFRNAALLDITGAVRGTSREKLYQELGFESLQQRRWYRKLCCLFKIINNSHRVISFTKCQMFCTKLRKYCPTSYKTWLF